MNTPSTLSLRSGWQQSLHRLHATPGRHYHTLSHIEEVIANWSAVNQAGLWQDPHASWVATALHDAVYTVGSSDNEQLSAALVRPWSARWIEGPLNLSAAQELILQTAHHGAGRQPKGDVALFLDCDMAILGAPTERFEQYEEQIRAEWLPLVGLDAYTKGRIRFLEKLLGAPVFHSPFWRERLEERAQHNLRVQLSRFRSPDTNGIQ